MTVSRSHSTLWLPPSYLSYNALLLLSMIWTIHSRDSEEGPFMGLCVNVASIVYDVGTLISFWPPGGSAGSRWFSGMCCILNLFMRPISSFVLYKILSERAATYGNFSLPSGLDNLIPTNLGNNRSPYEDIDQPVATQSLGPQVTDPMLSSPSHQHPAAYQAKPNEPIGFGS